jgi:hypothetical protein
VAHTRIPPTADVGLVVESGICFPRPSVKLPVLPAHA